MFIIIKIHGPLDYLKISIVQIDYVERESDPETTDDLKVEICSTGPDVEGEGGVVYNNQKVGQESK